MKRSRLGLIDLPLTATCSVTGIGTNKQTLFVVGLAYLQRGCPVLFSSDVLTDVIDSFGIRIVPKGEVRDLACKAAFVEASHDGETMPLLVRIILTRKSHVPTDREDSFLND